MAEDKSKTETVVINQEPFGIRPSPPQGIRPINTRADVANKKPETLAELLELLERHGIRA